MPIPTVVMKHDFTCSACGKVETRTSTAPAPAGLGQSEEPGPPLGWTKDEDGTWTCTVCNVR